MSTRKIVFGFVAVASALLMASTAFGAEVVVTSGASKAGKVSYAIDVVSSGDVASFNFSVQSPLISNAKSSMGGCLSDLPKGWSGGCNVVGDKMYVFATSDTLEPLAAGVHSVGIVHFNGGALAKEGSNVVIGDMFVGDVRGNAISSEAVTSDR